MDIVAYPGTHPMRPGAAERLDGWKSIAGYLRRDRTTVIRWARERGLPVYRLPGGQTGTVYALKHELDRWLGMPDAFDGGLKRVFPAPVYQAPDFQPQDGDPVTDRPATALRPAAGPRWFFALVGLVLGIGIGCAVTMQIGLPGISSAPMPSSAGRLP